MRILPANNCYSQNANSQKRDVNFQAILVSGTSSDRKIAKLLVSGDKFVKHRYIDNLYLNATERAQYRKLKRLSRIEGTEKISKFLFNLIDKSTPSVDLRSASNIKYVPKIKKTKKPYKVFKESAA